MSDAADPRFVNGGRRRAVRAAAAQIKEARQLITAEVAPKYERRLSEAGPVRRFWLRWRMSREIHARLAEEIEKFAPGDGLYARCGGSLGGGEAATEIAVERPKGQSPTLEKTALADGCGGP